MMRTYASRIKKPQAEPTLPKKSPVQAQPTTPVPPPLQAKTNEEGLAEWKAQQEKWERFGTPWKDKVPNPSGELAQPWIQRKLTLGQPGDKYEQEADRVASQVVHQISAPSLSQFNQGQSVQQENELKGEMQAKSLRAAIQRRQAMTDEEASADLESSINSSRGRGQPLDTVLQQSMGQAMGADFSGVRVHTDTQSDQLNQSIQARAFTTGQDVFFREGAYQPGDRGGQELIAHELTHVVQQHSSSTNDQIIRRMATNAAKTFLKKHKDNKDYRDLGNSNKDFDTFVDWLKQNEPSFKLDEKQEDIFESFKGIKNKKDLFKLAAKYINFKEQENIRKEQEEIERREQEYKEIWKGGEVEAEAIVSLMKQGQREIAFERLRSRMEKWKQKHRKEFMKNLPKQYHKLAFAAAIGEEEGLQWTKPLKLRNKPNERDKLAAAKSSPDMYKWLYERGPEPKKLNCWETVLLAGYRVGKINKSHIKKLIAHSRGKPEKLIKYVKSNGKNYYNPKRVEIDSTEVTNLTSGNSNLSEPGIQEKFAKLRIPPEDVNGVLTPLIRAGDIIMFGDGGEHFAICVGDGKLIENDSIQNSSDVRYGSIAGTMNRKTISYSYSVWWASPDKLFKVKEEQDEKKQKKKWEKERKERQERLDPGCLT